MDGKGGKKLSRAGFPKMTPNFLECSNRWFLANFNYLSAISLLAGPTLLMYLMFAPHQLGPNIQS